MFSNRQDGPGPLWVAAVALVDNHGRVLIQQRHEGGEHGTLWEFPGGKLDPGESPEAAAVRELHEELAVAISPSALRSIGFASGISQTGSGSRSLVILLFACTEWSGVPQARAAKDLAWCDPGDLETRAMPPLDYPLARALVTMLASGAI